MSIHAAPAVDLGSYSPLLGCACSDYLFEHTARMRHRVCTGEQGIGAAQYHARALDGLIGSLFCAATGAMVARGKGQSQGVVLLAAGGYGRGLVGLHSAAEVLFLCGKTADEAIVALAASTLAPLTTMGLRIGYAVRAVDDVIQQGLRDIGRAANLLDLRCLAGDRDLASRLLRRARETIFTPHRAQFIRLLRNETVLRHERYGGSAYLREPELNLSRGGLRDLDVISWVLQTRGSDLGLAHGEAERRMLGKGTSAALSGAREHLWRARNLLHLRAGRRQDRLTSEEQPEIARMLGYPEAKLGVERFVREHSLHAATVAAAIDRLWERAR
ncbi:MAG: hypothetical protein MJD61_06265 [Proteobacteria bacterium]|nr:hypothetical protein [Pseudomonadota bacterium]